MQKKFYLVYLCNYTGSNIKTSLLGIFFRCLCFTDILRGHILIPIVLQSFSTARDPCAVLYLFVMLYHVRYQTVNIIIYMFGDERISVKHCCCQCRLADGGLSYIG